MDINQIYNEDCQEGIKRIPYESIDCILTDPPYLYLKGQKLEREFDEQSLFTEFKRVLKPSGFVVLFGRGTSFYRWNTMLAELGFSFKEEIVWNKGCCTSPLMAISRVHETISIHTKGKGVIRKVKVPYLEMKAYDIPSICWDIKRLGSVLKNTKSLDAVLAFLENNFKRNDFRNMPEMANKYNFHGRCNECDRCVTVANAIINGMNEKTIIRSDLEDCDTFTKFGVTATGKRKTGDRCANVMQSTTFGLNEKSIIRETRNHHTAIQPTQKPVRLIERLLAIVTQPGDVILDPFSGSCSTAVACINTNRKFIGFEIDKEYYDEGTKRLDKVLSEPKLAM